MRNLIFGIILGSCLTTAVSIAGDDTRRPYFGFTPDGIAPIDQQGNRYDLSPSRSQQPQRTPLNPC